MIKIITNVQQNRKLTYEKAGVGNFFFETSIVVNYNFMRWKMSIQTITLLLYYMSVF